MVIGFVQGYEELKWGISKLNPLCNGPLGSFLTKYIKHNKFFPVWSRSNHSLGMSIKQPISFYIVSFSLLKIHFAMYIEIF